MTKVRKPRRRDGLLHLIVKEATLQVLRDQKSIKDAARVLGIPLRTLYNMLRRYGYRWDKTSREWTLSDETGAVVDRVLERLAVEETRLQLGLD